MESSIQTSVAAELSLPVTAKQREKSAKTASVFCKFDIRQPVGPGFDEETFRRLGEVWAALLREEGAKRFPEFPLALSLGYDARLHSPTLYEAFVVGVLSQGVDVWDYGLSPTPLIYFSEWVHTFQPGFPQCLGTALVTASHNPPEYNGLKFTLGGKPVPDELFKQYQQWFEGDGHDIPAYSGKPGQRHSGEGLKETYIRWFSQQFDFAPVSPGEKPLKVVLDSGNGTAGLIAPVLFRSLGCEVISLFEEPDGNFPNHHPDPCVLKNMAQLAEAVVAHGADVGFGFDGDSDRLGVVDNQGQPVPQDYIFLLMAKPILEAARLEANGHRPVFVAEVKMSQGVFDWIHAQGGEAIMVKTGHVFGKLAMAEHGGILAGELSGHHCFKDRYFGFDDAFYSACRLTEVLLHERRAEGTPVSLHDLLSRLPKSQISEEVRLHCEKEQRQRIMADIEKAITEEPGCFGPAISTIYRVDGLRMSFEGGFILIRASNTEPCLTLRWEALDDAVFNHLNRTLVETIRQRFMQ